MQHKTHDHFKPKIITVALKMTEIFNCKVLEKKVKKPVFLPDIAIAKVQFYFFSISLL
jgi:hypothetical protein